ncbi:MAG TPA: hypothetical protein VKD72_10310 [Gemmataceae bacterium]|nr:hypothetical protein [Gemmataceae bacterium]
MSAKPTFDRDGYPTDETLALIKHWPYQDAAGCLDYVKAAWHYPDWATHDLNAGEASVVRAEKGEKYLRLATGGWSGNEELVIALEDNHMMRAVTWRLDARGGLHIYQYPNDDASR